MESFGSRQDTNFLTNLSLSRSLARLSLSTLYDTR